MRFIFEKRMLFLLILTKSPENAHGLPMILEFQGSQIIPQQETSGNYNLDLRPCLGAIIIPQQETSRNTYWLLIFEDEIRWTCFDGWKRMATKAMRNCR